jgi:hypothetical protein
VSEAIDVARAFQAAWLAGDFEKARGYLADDIVLDSPFGRETSPEAIIGQYAGFSQAVSGPAREIAAFGEGERAMILSEIPTSTFGTQVSAALYVVRAGKIAAETLVYDATAIKASTAAVSGQSA